MSILLLINKPLGEKILIDMYKKGADISAIVTRKENSKNWWGENRINEIAKELGIETYDHHTNVKEKFDTIFSVQYDYILEKEFIKKAKQAINLHNAELPRYRGCNSTAHAIINARKDNYWKYGVTLHHINKRIDCGDIIDIKWIEFDEWITNKELYKLVEHQAYKLYDEYSIYIIEEKPLRGLKQKEHVDKYNPSYYYYRNSLDNKEIDLKKSNIYEVWDIARALFFPPFEPAYVIINDEKYHVIPHALGKTSIGPGYRVIRNTRELIEKVTSGYKKVIIDGIYPIELLQKKKRKRN